MYSKYFYSKSLQDFLHIFKWLIGVKNSALLNVSQYPTLMPELD